MFEVSGSVKGSLDAGGCSTALLIEKKQRGGWGFWIRRLPLHLLVRFSAADSARHRSTYNQSHRELSLQRTPYPLRLCRLGARKLVSAALETLTRSLIGKRDEAGNGNRPLVVLVGDKNFVEPLRRETTFLPPLLFPSPSLRRNFSVLVVTFPSPQSH